MNGSKRKLLGPERIKGILSADHKKRNFISIHEMVLFAFKYIFWPIHQQKIKQIFFSYFLCGIFCLYNIPQVEISFWSGIAFSVYQGRPTSLQRAFESLTFETVTIYFLFVPQVFNSRLRKPCLHIMVFFLLYLGTYFN